jgi:hypothetical protein
MYFLWGLLLSSGISAVPSRVSLVASHPCARANRSYSACCVYRCDRCACVSLFFSEFICHSATVGWKLKNSLPRPHKRNEIVSSPSIWGARSFSTQVWGGFGFVHYLVQLPRPTAIIIWRLWFRQPLMHQSTSIKLVGYHFASQSSYFFACCPLGLPVAKLRSLHEQCDITKVIE